MDIMNINQLPNEFVWKDSIGFVTQLLGAAAGSQKIYVNIDTVPPKGYSTKYHCHSQQEEFFIILSGAGILRLNDKEYKIKRNDLWIGPQSQMQKNEK